MGVVDEVGAVVDVEPGAVVVGVEGTEDVGVVGVVGADDELADASRSAVTIFPLGFGSVVPAGTKPTVMSWSFVKRSVEGLPLTVNGFALEEKAFGQ